MGVGGGGARAFFWRRIFPYSLEKKGRNIRIRLQRWWWWWCSWLYTQGRKKRGRIKDGFFWFREEGGRELMDAKTRTRKPQSCHVCWKKNSLVRAFESSFFSFFFSAARFFYFFFYQTLVRETKSRDPEEEKPPSNFEISPHSLALPYFPPPKNKRSKFDFYWAISRGKSGWVSFFISLRPLRFLLFYLGTFRRVVKANWFRKRREKTVLRDRILR